MLSHRLLFCFRIITKLSGVLTLVAVFLYFIHTFGVLHWSHFRFRQITFSIFMLGYGVYGFICVFLLPWEELVKSITLMKLINNLESQPIGLNSARKRKHYKYLFIQLIILLTALPTLIDFISSIKPVSDSAVIDILINPQRSLIYRTNVLLASTCFNCLICYLSTELEFTFKLINWQIACFARKIDATTQELNLIRRYYSMAIRSCQAADQFTRIFICIRLCNLVLNSPVVFIKHAHSDLSNQSYHFIIFYCAKFVSAVQLICYMVAVNSTSNDSFHDLNKISMRNDIDNQEIKLFLMRMKEKNVGFTFLKLCTIDKQFATSLLTFTLTVVLAAPTLFSLQS